MATYIFVDSVRDKIYPQSEFYVHPGDKVIFECVEASSVIWMYNGTKWILIWFPEEDILCIY